MTFSKIKNRGKQILDKPVYFSGIENIFRYGKSEHRSN